MIHKQFPPLGYVEKKQPKPKPKLTAKENEMIIRRVFHPKEPPGPYDWLWLTLFCLLMAGLGLGILYCAVIYS